MGSNWLACVDYSELNKATCKDHFFLPFKDQMLDRLCGMNFIVFLMAIRV